MKKLILTLTLALIIPLMYAANVQHSALVDAELHTPFQNGTDSASTYDSAPDVGDTYHETDAETLWICHTDDEWESMHRRLYDDDVDTKVDCEESADEDKIRFDTGGAERCLIAAQGILLNNQISIYDADNDTGICPDASSASDADDIEMYNANVKTFKIDSNGIITKPKQSSFMAYQGGGDQTNIAVGSEVTVLFSAEVYDLNADFNTGTYTYTAPVDGYYYFGCSVQLASIDTASTQFDVRLKTSNQTFNFGRVTPNATYAGDCRDSFTCSVICEMDASDTAVVTLYQTGGAQQTDVQSAQEQTWFSGTLIN